jgi:hypothetical protein
MSIIVKLAELAKALNAYVYYEYNLSVDKPGETYCSRREYYRIKADGYKTIYLPTFEQVMDLSIEYFKEEENT